MAPAGRPPRWDIKEVLDRTDLHALLDELAGPGTHHTRGRRWHCPMPDHDDHRPSVSTHVDSRGHERWRCWSGDQTHRGDAIDLIMVTQRLARGETIDWLANRAGMIPGHEPPPIHRKPRPPRPANMPLSAEAVRYIEACEHILWRVGGAPVRAWLRDRGFDDATLRANRVGADPGRDRLIPRRRGLPHGESLAATFPAFDPDGALTYVQARYLNPVDDKYDNPSGRHGSHPRLTWTRTPHTAPRPGVLVICEGPPDGLTAAQAGFHAAAILGFQAPDEGVASRLVARANEHGLELVAVIDADASGRTWGTQLTELVAARGSKLHVLEPPDGLDLNDWAQTTPDWPNAIEALLLETSTPQVSRPQPEPVGLGAPDL